MGMRYIFLMQIGYSAMCYESLSKCYAFGLNYDESGGATWNQCSPIHVTHGTAYQTGISISLQYHCFESCIISKTVSSNEISLSFKLLFDSCLFSLTLTLYNIRVSLSFDFFGKPKPLFFPLNTVSASENWCFSAARPNCVPKSSSLRHLLYAQPSF